jgi:hypothetical protein
MPYIIQSILILLAPILFAASIYMILGRLVTRTDSAVHSIVRATWVTKIFVTGDIVCFLIQSGGAGMLVQAKDQDGFKRGENIILGGLILQILIFGFFVVVAGIWHRRLKARPTAASADIPWTRYIRLLYAASVFITIRNICRVIEYAMGKVSCRSLQIGKTNLDIGGLSSPTRMATLSLRLHHDDVDTGRVHLMVRSQHQASTQARCRDCQVALDLHLRVERTGDQRRKSIDFEFLHPACHG